MPPSNHGRMNKKAEVPKGRCSTAQGEGARRAPEPWDWEEKKASPERAMQNRCVAPSGIRIKASRTSWERRRPRRLPFGHRDFGRMRNIYPLYSFSTCWPPRRRRSQGATRPPPWAVLHRACSAWFIFLRWLDAHAFEGPMTIKPPALPVR
jgi:hypothetical protein